MTMDAVSWLGLSARLESVVAALADGSSVLVDAGSANVRPFRRPSSGLRRMLLGARFEDVSPWVRLTRQEDHLRGTCVRSGPRGDGFPMSTDEVDHLHRLGWHDPGPADGDGYLRYWPDDIPNGPYLPRADQRAAVEATLTVLREVFGGEASQVRVHHAAS